VRRALILLAAAVTVSACAQDGDSVGPIQLGQIVGGATKQVPDMRATGDSLPEPSLLKPGTADDAALLYVNSSTKFPIYNKVLLAPVKVWPAPGSQLNKVYPEQKRELADTFDHDLFQAISPHCQIVTTPSRGTLQINVALVDVDLPDFLLNTLASYTPYLSTVYSAASFAFNHGVAYFAGSATAETYATDAMDGTLLWEDLDKRAGTTAFVENTFDALLDIHHAFEAWSAKLAARLQRLGACRTPAK
jgi:Protein of unknown function (DUF3313)